MDTDRIVREIDAEIQRLTSARSILTGLNSTARPRSYGKAAVARAAAGTKRVRRLTPAGRRKLSEMMKKRWAERRRLAAARAK